MQNVYNGPPYTVFSYNPEDTIFTIVLFIKVHGRRLHTPPRSTYLYAIDSYRKIRNISFLGWRHLKHLLSFKLAPQDKHTICPHGTKTNNDSLNRWQMGHFCFFTRCSPLANLVLFILYWSSRKRFCIPWTMEQLGEWNLWCCRTSLFSVHLDIFTPQWKQRTISPTPV